MRTAAYGVTVAGLSAWMLLAGGAEPARAQFKLKLPPLPPPPNTNYVPPADSGTNLYGGASGVIAAQGKYMTDTQKAYLMQEQVKQAKTDTKRKAFDEWKYEQANTPTPEEVRAKSRQQELQRSRYDPPLTEIWSAKALNDLLLDLQRLQGTSAYARSEMLDPKMLKRINVTTGKTATGLGLLRDADKLAWPLALQEADFDKERKQIEQLLSAAVKQAKAGAVQGNTLKELIGTVGKLNARVKAKVADMPSTQYIDAKRFATELEDATRVLQEPNVANYFNGKWEAKGATVSDLVRHLTTQGLRFAPATPGDEAFYTSLHRSLANYDMALSPQVVKK